MRRTDLTSQQQCVLVNAVEQTYLFDVLTECGHGRDWPDRMPHVPRLAKIVEEFIVQGFVTLTRDPDESGLPAVDIPDEQAHDILADPANWWSPDGVRPIALAPTDKGLALYRGTDVDADIARPEIG